MVILIGLYIRLRDPRLELQLMIYKYSFYRINQ